MTIQELKEKIENKESINQLLIFKYSDVDFVAIQYINEIAKINNVQVEVIDELSEINPSSNFFFDIRDSSDIKVYFTDNLEDEIDLTKHKNLCIITKKLSKDLIEKYKDYVIEIPKLEDWHIKDYVVTNAKGISDDKVNELMSVCKNDIYRIDNEINKLNIFEENERSILYDKFKKEGMFNDLTQNTIFNFTNAIIKRDRNQALSIYKELENMDVNTYGFLTIIYNNIRNIISVQLSPNPSPETCNLPSKQFWAVKYSCGYYSKDELLHAFNVITDIDRKIKTGEIDTSIVIDYLLVNIL